MIPARNAERINSIASNLAGRKKRSGISKCMLHRREISLRLSWTCWNAEKSSGGLWHYWIATCIVTPEVQWVLVCTWWSTELLSSSSADCISRCCEGLFKIFKAENFNPTRPDPRVDPTHRHLWFIYMLDRIRVRLWEHCQSLWRWSPRLFQWSL